MSIYIYAFIELVLWHHFFTIAASMCLNKRTERKSYRKTKFCQVTMEITFTPNSGFKNSTCKRQKELEPGIDVLI